MRAAVLLAFAAWVSCGAGPLRRPSWADLDGDGRDTRRQLLEERCITTTTALGRLDTAVCLDGYTGGLIFSQNPEREIEVDHPLPWAVASRRMPAWSKAGAAAFFNDPTGLVLTTRAANRSKGRKMPGEGWCPATPAARVATAGRIRAISGRHGIPLEPEEVAGLEAWELGECGGSK